MYEELVKALRGCVLTNPCDGCPYYDLNGPSEKCATMNIAAADAIVKLERLRNMAEENRLHWERMAVEFEIAVRTAERKLPKWIPVTERLPEEWKTVLTFQPTTTDDKGIIQTCVYIGVPGKWRQAWNHEFLELPVTHWMPLPEPPKEETE